MFETKKSPNGPSSNPEEDDDEKSDDDADYGGAGDKNNNMKTGKRNKKLKKKEHKKRRKNELIPEDCSEKDRSTADFSDEVSPQKLYELLIQGLESNEEENISDALKFSKNNESVIIQTVQKLSLDSLEMFLKVLQKRIQMKSNRNMSHLLWLEKTIQSRLNLLVTVSLLESDPDDDNVEYV